ncbi:hypothetical protein [Kitasatospora xanthocidica]|uniref:hypothetical protein n=1 Tax=Kitasatospora xanthocidica TaxID=83382 RepID=UPI001E54363C|nr:hypothetical protein [Kitasatospora xanthocidica]
MTTIRTRWGRLRIPAVAALAVLAAGCGTTHVDAPGGTAARTPAATAVATAQGDHPCPGETPTRTPTATASNAEATGPVTDHYAENHAFKAPLPLHGERRCEGLEAVRRIKAALEPVRARYQVDPDGIRKALVGLGYPADKVKVQRGGEFLIDATGLCLSGSTAGEATTVEAFAGYAEGTGCEEPRGGH